MTIMIVQGRNLYQMAITSSSEFRLRRTRYQKNLDIVLIGNEQFASDRKT